MTKTIDVACAGCGKIFQKDFYEHHRRLRKNQTKFYCIQSCYNNTDAKNNGKHLPTDTGQRYKHNLVANNRLDVFSPFRYYQRQLKRNEVKYGKSDLVIEDLVNLWDSQQGICPYTNIRMVMPATMKGLHNTVNCASLDRIDHTQGYIKGNVEFVTLLINYAKNAFTKEDVIAFLKLVKMVDLAEIESA